MRYNRNILRKIIKDLTDPEFDESLDDFPRVRNQFTRGMDKNDKVKVILDYFEKTPKEFNQFLIDIKKCNSTAYENYISQLEKIQIEKFQKPFNKTSLEPILPQEDNFFWQCANQVYQDFLLELGESYPYLDENPNNLDNLLWELENLSEQEVVEKFITRLIAYLSVCCLEKYRDHLGELRKWTTDKIGLPIFQNQYGQFKKEYNQQPFIYPVKVVNFQTPTVNRRGEIIKRETKKAQYFTENLPNNIALEMVYIPGGTFMMGSPEGEGSDKEKPQHQVTVTPFFMGKYQITQEQWKAVANLPQVERELKLEPSNFKGDRHPVEKVSWYDAVEFCARLSKHTGKEYRLPSEAEWEYACRAVTTTPFYFGETITDKLANYRASAIFADEPKGEYREKTTPVGQFLPNAFGLHDMHGNLWEWCKDHWHENYQGAPKDGNVWLYGNDNRFRVLRGGSWDDNPDICRSTFRIFTYSVNDVSNHVGLRVVCGVSPRT